MRPIALKVLILTAAMAGMGMAANDGEPERGVARVSVINGDVSVRRGDSGDWVAAAVNAPLVVEDSLFTGEGSRAEVQFDWANVIRLAPNSEIRLAQLDYQRYLIQVARGTVTFRVERNSEADAELSTPSVSVRPARKGTYRVTVREDGESEITVRSGEAEVFTPRGSERLRSGRTMIARGSASDPEFQMVSEIPNDDWDRWNEQRDRYLGRAEGYRYANSSVYGVEDLDGYGHWVNVAPYGWCWYPSVAVGWAPYRSGRWAWVDWYGWTWVSYDPWGWAPYHYGRWFRNDRYGWCWWPGGYHARHYWRPALVAFFGWGGYSGVHAGIGFGYGNVGWVPLAPYEPYYPWYGHRYYRGYRNSTYIDNSVNIVNNTNIYNIYRNARVQNAVTAVDSSQFGRGSGNIMRVSGDELRRAGLVKGQLPVAPGRESLRLSNRDVQRVGLPRDVGGGRFFSRSQPATVDRVPFEQQQRSLEAISRRGAGAPSAIQGSAPAQAGERNVVRMPTERNSGWRRIGEPAGQGNVTAGSIPQVTERSRSRQDAQIGVRTRTEQERPNTGRWQSFGQPADRGGLAGQQESGRSIVQPRMKTPVEPGTTLQNPGAREQGRAAPEIYQRRGADRSEQFGRVESQGRSMERNDSRGRAESIRISPPIVRERSAAGVERGRAMPRISEPRVGGSVERSAPRGGEARGGSVSRGDSGARTSGGEGRSGGRGRR